VSLFLHLLLFILITNLYLLFLGLLNKILAHYIK
jgi:hypothetical protein